jgi:hypothetical protein
MTAQRAAVDDEMQSLLSRKLLRITDSAGIMRRELAAVASHGQLIAGSMRIGAEGSDAATERGTSEGTSGGSGRADGTVAEIVRLLGLCDAELEKVSIGRTPRSLPAATETRARAGTPTHKATAVYADRKSEHWMHAYSHHPSQALARAVAAEPCSRPRPVLGRGLCVLTQALALPPPEAPRPIPTLVRAHAVPLHTRYAFATSSTFAIASTCAATRMGSPLRAPLPVRRCMACVHRL